MLIKNFTDSDILQASKLSQLTWGNFYTNESNELQNLIYETMVEYYDINRKYSFSITDTELKGFLLAFKKNDFHKLPNFERKAKALKNKNEQKIAIDLINYLESSENELKEFITDNDIIIGLFVSIKKGCGKLLLSKLNSVCKENNINNIYLWTDTTCDYEYYKKNNFVLEKSIETYINKKTIETLIYKKEVIY